MTGDAVGILHPGEMGVSVAASARSGGYAVYWASDGRSARTAERAARAGLTDAKTLPALCEMCSVIVSVCPPAFAEDVAGQVLEWGFSGLYLDANAISPERSRRIGQALAAAGAEYVDGGIIGGPAWEPGRTWLYLSGPAARRAASYFSAGPLETRVIGHDPGRASALKMCYAAFTKGSTALLCEVLAAAESLGVRADLEDQWDRDDPEAAAKAARSAREVTRKAWRFAPEMDEIAATMIDAGLPGGFHEAAGELYRRLAEFKDEIETPPLEAVLQALLADEHA